MHKKCIEIKIPEPEVYKVASSSDSLSPFSAHLTLPAGIPGSCWGWTSGLAPPFLPPASVAPSPQHSVWLEPVCWQLRLTFQYLL